MYKKTNLALLFFLVLFCFASCQKENTDPNNNTGGGNNNGGGSGTNTGKVTVFITGNVTDAEAADIIATDFGTSTQVVNILNTTQLTTVDLSMATTLVDLKLDGNAQLSSIDLSNLETVNGDLTIGYGNDNPALTSLSLPKLQQIYGSTIFYSSGLTALSMPLLETTGDLNFSVTLSSLDVSSLTTVNGGLSGFDFTITALDLSKLESVRDDFQLYRGAMTSIDLSSLTTIRDCRFEDNNALTSLDLPSLTTISSEVDIENNDNLQSVTLPALTSVSSLNLRNALTSASVNSILAKLVSISPAISSANIYLEQTPAAPPTGQGITDKNTLVSNGNTVYTD